jgi:SAM-dependent methyltransferase
MPDWDAHYREGNMPWDKGAPAPPLVEWIENNPGRLTGRGLVPGCGLGYDVRLLAAAGAGAVTGLDLSPTAIEMAGEITPAGGEDYLVADLFSYADEHRGSFDWIWEHTLFCAIDPEERARYLSAVSTLLKPGGLLLAVFFLDPYDDEHQPGGGPPHGCHEDELRERFVGSGLFEWLHSYVPVRAYPGREDAELVVELRRLG